MHPRAQHQRPAIRGLQSEACNQRPLRSEARPIRNPSNQKLLRQSRAYFFFAGSELPACGLLLLVLALALSFCFWSRCLFFGDLSPTISLL